MYSKNSTFLNTEKGQFSQTKTVFLLKLDLQVLIEHNVP